jgi:hypothetical protein
VQPSRDRLGDGSVVMRQLVRTDVMTLENAGQSEVRESCHEGAGQCHGDQSERVTTASQVGRAKRGAAEWGERLAQCVLDGAGQVTDRRPVVQVEPTDRLSGLEEGRREEVALDARRIPGKTAPDDSIAFRPIRVAQA